MKSKQLTETDKFILLPVAFTILLLTIRIVKYNEAGYMFYPWNIFLAIIPFLFSRALQHCKKLNFTSALFFMLWLLFFPNAPYLLTDVFHFEQTLWVPAWFDLLIVASGTWTGLLISVISLRQVERFIEAIKPGITKFITPALLLLSSYGVYIGRYLRYNSWDVVTRPGTIIKSSGRHVIDPVANLNVWMFTFFFTAFLSIIFFSVKRLQLTTAQNQ